MKANGFRVLHNCMNLVFRDLITEPEEGSLTVDGPLHSQHSANQFLEQHHDNILSSPSTYKPSALSTHRRPSTQVSDPFEDEKINFTTSTQLSRYFKANSMNVCKGILSIRIIEQVFTSIQF